MNFVTIVVEYFTICINMACEKSDFLPIIYCCGTKSGDKLSVYDVASLRKSTF